MTILFTLLFLVSGGVFLVGLINPGLTFMPSRKRSSLVYGSGVIAFLIASAATMPKQPTQKTTQTKQNEQINTENNDQQRTYSTGDTINHNDWSLTINRVTTKQNIGGQLGKDANGKFLVVFGTVENSTGQTNGLPGSFRVDNSQG